MTSYYLATEDQRTITTEDGRKLVLFESGASMFYRLDIDWADEGFGSVNSEGSRVVSYQCERGREHPFNPSGNGFAPYDIGTLTIELDNWDDRYNPWNTASELYGNIEPGKLMRFMVGYATTDDALESDYAFSGILTNVRLNGHKNTATMSFDDGWRYLADADYLRPADSASSYSYYGEIGGMLKNEVDYPWGNDILPSTGSTDLPRHWWWDGSAKGAIEMITFGSLGRSYVETDGTFGYRGLYETTDSSVATLSQDECLKNVYLPVPWDNLRSKAVLKGSKQRYYYYSDALEVASIPLPIKIDAGQTVEPVLNYEFGDVSIHSPGDTHSVTLAGNTNAGGGGTNISADLTYVITRYVDTVKVSITNTGGLNGYVTVCVLYSKVLEYIPATFEHASTDGTMRDSTFTLDSQWLSITNQNKETYDEDTSTTLDDIARIDTVGTTLVDYLSVSRQYPAIQVQGRPRLQFPIELEDKIAADFATMGISDDFRVCKIKHQTLSCSQDVLTTYWLYPVMTPV